MVGIAIKVLGRGITATVGILGAGLALFSVVLGKALATITLVAYGMQTDFLSVMTMLGPGDMLAIFQEAFSPIDLLFYGIAIWEGFKISVNDKAEIMPSSGTSTVWGTRRWGWGSRGAFVYRVVSWETSSSDELAAVYVFFYA